MNSLLKFKPNLPISRSIKRQMTLIETHIQYIDLWDLQEKMENSLKMKLKVGKFPHAYYLPHNSSLIGYLKTIKVAPVLLSSK